jgi:hypothetical protein
MLKLFVFHRQSPLGPGLLWVAALLLVSALLVVPCALGQTTGGDPNTSGGGTTGGNPTTGGESGQNPGQNLTPGGTPNVVGYGSIANGTVPSSTLLFMGLTSSSVFVVPFAFDSLGNYSLTSVSLLLSSSSGTANLSDLPLKIFSTQPITTLSLPTAVTTFFATGSIASNQAIYTFSPSSSPTLLPHTTYYLGVTYVGTDSVDWNETGMDNFAAVDGALTDTFPDGTDFNYFIVGDGGFDTLQGNIGGFSITASAVSAIPEPAAVGAIAALCVLALALLVRWRRSRAVRVER